MFPGLHWYMKCTWNNMPMDPMMKWYWRGDYPMMQWGEGYPMQTGSGTRLEWGFYAMIQCIHRRVFVVRYLMKQWDWNPPVDRMTRHNWKPSPPHRTAYEGGMCIEVIWLFVISSLLTCDFVNIFKVIKAYDYSLYSVYRFSKGFLFWVKMDKNGIEFKLIARYVCKRNSCRASQ